MRRVRVVTIILIVCMFIMITGPASAQTADTVHIRAGHMEYSNNKIVITDNVKIIKDENTITAPRGEYYREENRAFLQDGVAVDYKNGTVSSREMTAWLKEDKYIFREEVKLNHKPEEGEQFTMESPYLEMYTDDNSFRAEQGVLIEQKSRKLRGDTATYDDQQQLLTLTGNVEINEDGDWIKSNKAELHLGSEDEGFTADGQVELEIKLSEEKDE